uniref:EB domain-containing protein n=1 Tax=Caenorhabditis japonica TaxID=281687 RepID=A0A8R1HUZ6_CAEJA
MKVSVLILSLFVTGALSKCISHSDCFNHETCVHGECINMWASRFLFDRRCLACPDGYFCSRGKCFPVTKNLISINIANVCSTGADCDDQSDCIDGKCVVSNGSGGLCSGDAWCPDGYTCVDSKCQAAKRHFLPYLYRQKGGARVFY